MALHKKDRIKAARRALRVKSTLKKGTKDCPRVAVYRSLNAIFAQVIDDSAHHTIMSVSTNNFADQKGKKAQAYAAGYSLGAAAQGTGIQTMVFDRGRYKFHGRVKAFADGLRAAGVAV